MRFLYILAQKSVPEWADCYYDYQTHKKLIGICRKAISIQANIMDMTGQNSDHAIEQLDNGSALMSKKHRQELYHQKSGQIRQIVEKANEYFFCYHSFNKQVVFLFLQMKVHELTIRFTNYQNWDNIQELASSDALASLIANCYNQNKMLNTMAEMNLEAYRKIVKKHRKVFSRFQMATPINRTSRINRSLKEIKQQTAKLQMIYAKRKDVYPRQARSILGEELEESTITSSLVSYALGLFNGFSLATLITSIVLILIHLLNDVAFSVEYRIWKFEAFVILYMWVFGITLYLYEKKRINYHLIFSFQTPENKSKNILMAATLFTLLYAIFFIFYVLYKGKIFREDASWMINVFPAILSILIGLSFILRLTFFRSDSSNFFLKSLFSVFLCFFPCFKITFAITWAAEQMISLVQLFTDFTYSICYYSRSDEMEKYLLGSGTYDPCRDTLLAAQIVAMIIFSIRGIQCLRLLIEKGGYIRHEVFILIRSTINVILCGLAIGLAMNRLDLQTSQLPQVRENASINIQNIGPIIILIGIIAVIFSFLVDLYIQWQIVQFHKVNQSEPQLIWRTIGRKPTLRKKKQFPILVYYGIICLNLFLRCAWVLSFCPHIIYSYRTVYFAEGIITICAISQLCRRGVWNILRVENEHIKNCELFRVRMDYNEKESIIYKEIDHLFGENHERSYNHTMSLKDRRLQVERNEAQMKNVKQYLVMKKSLQSKIGQWIQENEKMLQTIEKDTFNLISS